MKKLFSLVFMLLCLVSCKDKKTSEDIVNSICETVLNCDSYKSVATLKNNSDNGNVFNIETLYMKGGYYKVTYNNSTNSTKQIILKNNDGVFALTPSISKQFKFESLWPDNGSHIYMPTSIINDYKKDENREVLEENGNLILSSAISHKTHDNYKYQHIVVNPKKNAICEVNYYDDNKNIVCTVNYDSITFNLNLSVADFNPSNVINVEIDSTGEGSVAKIDGNIEVGYIIEGSKLISNNDSIFVYQGQLNYTIAVSDIISDDYLGVSRIYNDFLLSNKGLIFKNENSMTLLYQNKEIRVLSSDISDAEIINIFNSISFI